MTYEEIYQAYKVWAKNHVVSMAELTEPGPVITKDLADDVTLAYYVVADCDKGLRLFIFYERLVWQVDEKGDRNAVLSEEYGLGSQGPDA